MKLSTKGRYAMVALADIALQPEGSLVNLGEIAKRQDLSLPYLEQLFVKLRREGLVDSVRGPGGGYRLAAPAEQLSVGAIVVAVDEPLKVTRCASEAAGRGCMPGGEQCITHRLGEELGDQIQACLDGVTLADVVENRVRRSRKPLVAA